MTAPEITPEQARRDSRGRFLPGVTGNRGGRPRVAADVRQAIKRLLEENALSLHGWLARVAKTNPAKAVALYTAMADFVTPRLLRSEVTPHLQVEMGMTNDPIAAARMYQAMINGAEIDLIASPAPQDAMQAPSSPSGPPNYRPAAESPP